MFNANQPTDKPTVFIEIAARKATYGFKAYLNTNTLFEISRIISEVVEPASKLGTCFLDINHGGGMTLVTVYTNDSGFAHHFKVAARLAKTV